MSETPASLPSPAGRPAAPLGVLDAIGMGWRLMTSDFWRLWVVAFLAFILSALAGPGAIIVAPPLAAGMFYVLALRMQGRPFRVGDLFQGFSQRFKPSLIAGLIPYGVLYLGPLLWVPFHLLCVFGAMAVAEGMRDEAGGFAFAGFICLDILVYTLIMLGVLVVRMLFTFAQCAVWSFPNSGWEGAKDAVRLARDHIGSVIGLWLLFVLIWLGGVIVGYLACVVGVFFVMPIVDLWYSASVVHLYTAWTGRPMPTPPVAPAPPPMPPPVTAPEA